MKQHNITDIGRTIYVAPCVAGIHLDYSLGEELPLFAPLPTDKLVHGVGYNSKERRKALGLPYYEKTSRSYHRWSAMLSRCYTSGAAAYIGCTVCRKWHDFQEFAVWFAAQPYADEENVEVDKDILDPLNTVYSPEFCSLVPKVINQMFRNTRSQRGILPIGVNVASSGKGFVARISKYGKEAYLGTFSDIHEAFEAYKSAHKEYCNELAEMYDGLISVRVIERLRAYNRHIRD